MPHYIRETVVKTDPGPDDHVFSTPIPHDPRLMTHWVNKMVAARNHAHGSAAAHSHPSATAIGRVGVFLSVNRNSVTPGGNTRFYRCYAEIRDGASAKVDSGTHWLVNTYAGDSDPPLSMGTTPMFSVWTVPAGTPGTKFVPLTGTLSEAFFHTKSTGSLRFDVYYETVRAARTFRLGANLVGPTALGSDSIPVP